MVLPGAGGPLGSVGLEPPLNLSQAARPKESAQASEIPAIRIFGLVLEA
jgi:hypothetical protein